MATLSEVLGVASMTRNDFNYLKRSGLLKTKYRHVAAGAVALLSRDNALEVVFLGSLRSLGVNWEIATSLADEWLSLIHQKSLATMIAINPSTGMNFEFSNADLSIAKIANRMPDATGIRSGWEGDEPVASAAHHPAARIAVINRKELIRRVDALFVEKK